MALMDQAEQAAKRNRFEPVTQEFDETKGVAGRVNSLISSGSPLMKTAQTRAAQMANARGLKNSSLGVQAGQQAVIETATPIATADAGMFQTQALANQTAKNTAGQFNSGQATGAALTGMQLGENARQFDKNDSLARDQFGETKRQFDTNAGLARDQFGETKRQFDTTSTLQRDQFTSDAAFRNAQLAESQRQFGAGQDLTRELATKDDAFRNTQLSQQQRQFDASQQQAITLANMDVASREKLLGIEAAFKTDIQRDLNISNAWGSTQTAIGQIQNNANLDAGTKTVLIQNTLDQFKAFTNFWKKTSGDDADVSDLLNFGIAGAGSTPDTAAQPDQGAPQGGGASYPTGELARVPGYTDPNGIYRPPVWDQGA